MTYENTMARLRRAGTAQNRKVYARHGIVGEHFGVAFGEIRKLAQEIKIDSDLAQELWASGNHDARILATMIIDPADCGAPLIEKWVKDLDNYVIADAFSRLVGQTGHALRKADKWTKSKEDYVAQAGWNLVGVLAMDERCSNDWLQKRMHEIRDEIAARPNRTRHAMNGALICVGIARGDLREECVAIAEQISPVEVDHGETDCKTPDAKDYIFKSLAHRAAKLQQRRQAAAQPAAKKAPGKGKPRRARR